VTRPLAESSSIQQI